MSGLRNIISKSLVACRRACLKPTTSSSVHAFRTYMNDNKEKEITITLNQDGKTKTVTCMTGEVLRDVVYKHVIEDIPNYGLCDAAMLCTLCYVAFSEEDFKKLPPRIFNEVEAMLGVNKVYPKTTRLACCVTVTEIMDGMVIDVPRFRKDARYTFLNPLTAAQYDAEMEKLQKD